MSAALLFAILPSHCAQAEPPATPRENHVETRLIADVQSIEPGQVFRIGVVYAIEEHGHIYWRNPGSSGFATEINWTLPEGFTVGPLQWPAPSRYEITEIEDISYGYDTQSLLFAGVRADPKLEPGETLRVKAQTQWLICIESGQCIAEKATLHMDLKVGKSKPSDDSALFDTYTRRLPVALSDQTPVTIERRPGTSPEIVITANEPWQFATGEGAESPLFFPNEGEAWNSVLREEDEPADSITFKAIDPDSDPTTRGVLEVSLKSTKTSPERRLYIEIR